MAYLSNVTILILGLATTLVVVVRAVESKKAIIDDAVDYKPIHPNYNPEHFGKKVWLSRRGSSGGSSDDVKLISKTAIINPSKVKPVKFPNLRALLKEKLYLRDKKKSSVGTSSKTVTRKSSHLKIHDPSIKVLRKRETDDDSGADDAKTRKPKGKGKVTKKSKQPKKSGNSAPGAPSTAAPDGGAGTTGAPGGHGSGSTTSGPNDDSTAKSSEADSTTKKPKQKPDDEDQILEELLKDKADEKKIISKVYLECEKWIEWLYTHNFHSLNRKMGSRVKNYIQKYLFPYVPGDSGIAPYAARPEIVNPIGTRGPAPFIFSRTADN